MAHPESIVVSSTIDSSTILQKALALAKRLDVPFSSSPKQGLYEFILAFTAEGLQLLSTPVAAKKAAAHLLYVDFVRGKNGYRFNRNRTIKQPLARAVGIKSGFRPTVLDGTAGLGADAFVLASLGCHVTMCERSPVLGALLEDGLERALAADQTKKIVAENLLFIAEDSCDYLVTTKKSYHTIYLDPMYPHRRQSALNKQALRIIRILVGDDHDGGRLLETARQKAMNRVVVKRPVMAPCLADQPPTYTVAMQKSRFDIYLTGKY